MGFFKDIDEGKIDSNKGNTESIEEPGEGMTAEEALALLDDDFNSIDGDSNSDVAPEELENIDMDLLDSIVSIDTADTAQDGVKDEIKSVNNEIVDSAELETTVITKGTTIRGGISSDCSLDVMGIITGDVDCQGKLSIYGTVSGNTTAAEIVVNTPTRLVGDLNSSGCIKVVEGSVVVGTITASSAYIAGAVKGDIEVQGPVIVDAGAIILGNITARTLQFNNGAVLEGICTVGVSDLDLNSFFESQE